MQRLLKNRLLIALAMAVVIIAVAIVGIRGVLSNNVSNINNKLFDANAQSLSETYREVASSFSQSANERFNYLNDIDALLNEAGSSGTGKVKDYLSSIKEERGFTGFFFVSDSGSYVSLDGSKGYIDFGDSLFDLFDEGLNVITDGTLPGKENVMFYAIPVATKSIDGFTYSALAFGYDLEDMSNLFEVSAYGGKSNAYVTYPNGRVATYASNNSMVFGNVVSHLREQGVSSAIADEVEQGLRNQGESTILATMGDHDYYVHYQPLSIQGWMLVSITEADAINAATKEVLSLTSVSLWTVFGVLVAVILAFLAVVVAYFVRRNKSEIAKRDQMFEALSNNVEDAYFMLSVPDCTVEYMSQNAEKLFGIEIDKLRRDFWCLGEVVEGGFPWSAQEFTSLEPGAVESKDVNATNARTGVTRTYHIRAERPEEMAEAHVLLVMTDFTKEEETRRQINAARESAEKANRAKTAFLNSMSHDIRTPMNAIVGFTDLALDKEDEPETVHDYLSKIQKSSSLLLSLINDVLDMSRIESGKVNIDPEPAIIPEILEGIHSIMQNGMTERNLEFTIDYSGVEHDYVMCDNLRMNQILINLTSNAMKYTEPGGIVNVKVIELPGAPDGFANYEFSVADTGIGMSPEFAAIIFDAFTREQSSTVSKIQGTGLGMSITKSLVDLMGGTINVHTERGVGSEFTVNVQLRIDEEGPFRVRAFAAEAGSFDVGSFEGRRVLLVDDVELNREIATAILEETGLVIETAENGQEAVDMVTRSEGRFDLVLMDIMMPVMDGYEATRSIRQLSDRKLARIPIIAMTANAFDEDKRNAAEAGMDGHLSKPIDVPELMRTLAGILGGNSSRPVSDAEDAGKVEAAHEKKVLMKLQQSFASMVVPGGFFAYWAQRPEEKLIYANEMACRIWGCEDYQELYDMAGGSFKGLVHPDDYERAEHEIWACINGGNDDLDQTKYRIIKKDGSISHIDDYGRLVRDPEHGDIFYVFVSESAGNVSGAEL